MFRKTIPAVVAGLLAAAVLVLSGCSTGTLSDDYSAPGSDPQYEQYEQYEIEQDQQAEQSEDEYVPDWRQQEKEYDESLNEQNRLRGEGWGGKSRLRSGDDFEDRCEYDPTYNDDWHDDMVCDGERLYLLPDDNYVEQAELEQAARKWIANQ